MFIYIICSVLAHKVESRHIADSVLFRKPGDGGNQKLFPVESSSPTRISTYISFITLHGVAQSPAMIDEQAELRRKSGKSSKGTAHLKINYQII